MGKKEFFNFAFRIFNGLTIKKKRSIYFTLDLSSKKNCEDVFNSNGSNTLKFLQAFVEKKHQDKTTVFVDYFDEDRLADYLKLAKKVKENNVDLRFIRSYEDKKGLKRILLFLKKYHCLYKCFFFIVGSGDAYIYGKQKKQSIINLNYFITCKNDFVPGNNYRWAFLDGIITTSQLNSTAVSAQTGVKFDRCIELGFPRNDTFFNNQDKKDVIKRWIENEVGFDPQKIVIYAPTYRDYEKNDKNAKERYLFGYDLPGLDEFLLKNRICMVCKLHNLQSKSILNYPKGVIDFKICFDFSFYDLMSISDCLITDYSSVGYDYMLMDKPLIYNLFDLEKYVEDRGVSYSPYEFFCPGAVVKNASEMMNELTRVQNNSDPYEEKRKALLNVFHKYPDGRSTERVMDYFEKRFGFKYERDSEGACQV